MGFGGSSLFGLVALGAAPSSWWDDLSALLLEMLFAVSALALAAALVFRRRFRRLSPRRQWALAWFASLAVVALSLAVVVTFDD